jgi:hypothetical protein
MQQQIDIDKIFEKLKEVNQNLDFIIERYEQNEGEKCTTTRICNE